jgi:hypothetical protein
MPIGPISLAARIFEQKLTKVVAPSLIGEQAVRLAELTRITKFIDLGEA